MLCVFLFVDLSSESLCATVYNWGNCTDQGVRRNSGWWRKGKELCLERIAGTGAMKGALKTTAVGANWEVGRKTI